MVSRMVQKLVFFGYFWSNLARFWAIEIQNDHVEVNLSRRKLFFLKRNHDFPFLSKVNPPLIAASKMFKSSLFFDHFGSRWLIPDCLCSYNSRETRFCYGEHPHALRNSERTIHVWTDAGKHYKGRAFVCFVLEWITKTYTQCDHYGTGFPNISGFSAKYLELWIYRSISSWAVMERETAMANSALWKWHTRRIVSGGFHKFADP